MSIEEEIKSKVREISRDLEEDRELQLDVEMELESHLWESYDNALDRGLSEAESKEHAFKEFGEIVEVKSRIISGNIKRMKSRARLKVLLWYAFLPLALLSALYLGWSELSELHMVNDTMRNKTRIIAQVEKDSPLIKLREVEGSNEKLNEQTYQFLLKQFPDNAYIDSLWLSANNGKCIDPESGEITDQKIYRSLIDKLKVMSKKSEYTAYHYEELKKIQHFGKPGFSKLIMHIGHAASFILPSMSMWRVLGRAVFESGNVDDIILYGDVCKKMFKGSDTLITGLVVGAIGRMFLENAETAKNVQKVSPETYKFFKRANDAVSNWRASKVDEDDRHKLIKDKGSILVSMIMPSLRGTSGIITEESLEPSRKMEYSFFEKIYFILLNSLVFIVTISVIALAFIARFMTKGKAFIISLSLREWLSHVGKTILVPLLCYQLFKLLPFSSYENSFRESFWGLGLEIFTLTVLITYWSSYVILKKHSDRLEILDLEERSPVNLKTYSLVFFSMILLSIVVCFSFNQQVVDLLYGIDILVRLDALREGESSKGISALEYLEMIVASLIFLGFLWRTLWQQASMKAASVFSLASGMALHLAFMALVLGLYSTVYLGTVEKHYFEKDTLLVNLDNPTLFTSVEEHVVRKLKQQILESSD